MEKQVMFDEVDKAFFDLFFTNGEEKYRVLDCEFMAAKNVLFLHLQKRVSDTVSERVYLPIEEPRYDIYFRQGFERIYYEDKDKLAHVNVMYNYRFHEIAKHLNIVDPELKEQQWEIKSRARSRLMSNQRLFGADYNINYVYTRKVTDYLESRGMYDKSIPPRVLYADIETAFDYVSYETFEHFLDSKTHKEFQKGFKSYDTYAHIIKSHGMTYETISNKIISEYSSPNSRTYIWSGEFAKDIKFFLEILGTCDDLNNSIYDRLKANLSVCRSDLYSGKEVNEEAAMSRIEMITSYLPQDKDMLARLLIREEMPMEIGMKLLNDPQYLETITLRYERYFRLSKFRAIVRNVSESLQEKIVKEIRPTALDEFIEMMNQVGLNSLLTDDVSQEAVDLAFDLVRVTDVEIPDFKFKLLLYTCEQTLIIDHYNYIKFTAKPSYVIFHNNKFDIRYLTGRLQKAFNLEPLDFLNQYDTISMDYNAGELKLNMDSKIRIDDYAPSVKHSKTNLTGFGIIDADSMVLRAKMKMGEVPNSLNAALKDEVGEEKFKYGVPTMSLLYRHVDHFIKYSMIDTLMLDVLVEKMSMLNIRQMLIEGGVQWRDAFSAVAISEADLRKVALYDFGKITQNNPNGFLDKEGKLENIPLVGAYVTSPTIGETYGVHNQVLSIDAAQLYPSIMMQANCMVDTFIVAFDDAEKIKTMVSQPMMFMKKYYDVDITEINDMLTKDDLFTVVQ